MDTAEIEVFLVLAEELHFGRTAERLRLPQPRVSRLVAALERRAGGALFERTSRRVRLTPLGQQLASQLRPAYAQLTAEGANRYVASPSVKATLSKDATVHQGAIESANAGILLAAKRTGRQVDDRLIIDMGHTDLHSLGKVHAPMHVAREHGAA